MAEDPAMYRLSAYFEDSRPVLDVRYAMERRVRRFLPRDQNRPGVLVFRGDPPPNGTAVAIELRLEAVLDSFNVYLLQVEFPARSLANMQRVFDGWTSVLKLHECPAEGSSERYHAVLRDTIERDVEPVPGPDDDVAIHAVQHSIVEALRKGKLFFTANKEGGWHVKFMTDRFVFQAYGEDDTREEFVSEGDFLARLRKFYDWPARSEWYPHTPPEIETWKYIERQLK